ncbi:hypothetical protein [Arthrobacter sp. PAMC 25486]|uniref:hypothetical protein n=1 Tax=Arthrobacter sp. PAMC 25486 TaxID=1494608 RepID=UPI00138E0F62|nr:hypothetical protein [Arthrobacter sp. PAMC 25486]
MGWVLRTVIAVMGLVLAALLAGCSSAPGSAPAPGVAGAVQWIYAHAEGVRDDDLVKRQARDVTVFNWSAELGLGEPFSARALEAGYANSMTPAGPTMTPQGPSAAAGVVDAGSDGAYGARIMSLWDFYLEEVERREQQLRDHLLEGLSLDEVRTFYDSHADAFSRQDEIALKITEWENGRALASSEVTIDAGNVRMLQEGDDTVISAALGLTAGQQATAQRPDGRFAQLECLSRKDGGVEDFDAVVQAAASQLATERFEAELLRRLGGAS